MKVKVKRCELRDGERQDGTSYLGVSAVVIFQDGKTAERVFISDEIIDPDKVVVDGIYDMYRSERGNVLVFDKIEPNINN